MTSLTKTKVSYSIKVRRGSQSSLSIDRTGLDVQDIPPQLCHLTRDALSTPFPPIALGGYIKYYKTYCGQYPSSQAQEQAETQLTLRDSLRERKRRRRASSASTILGPLLSHTPKPSPSREVPPKSRLFHVRPHTAPSASSVSPPGSPLSRLKHSLAIIHEASRETMHADKNSIDINTLPATATTSPRRSRVISFPSPSETSQPTKSSSLTASALALSLLAVTPPPRSSSLAKSNSIKSTASSAPTSPTGSLLRRRKRQLLRTPSVENDFARCAKELLGLGEFGLVAGGGGPAMISRESSSGSERTGEEEDDLGLVGEGRSPSESTAATSIFAPSSPSSPTKSDEKGEQHSGNISEEDDTQNATADTTSHTLPRPIIICHAKSDTSQSTEGEELSEAESNTSVVVSTPPTSVGCELLEDDSKIQALVEVQEEDEEEEGTRDSWASYWTAQTYIETPLSVDGAGQVAKGEIGIMASG